MIIFNNDKELKNPYTKTNGKIIEINSPLSLKEIYDLMQKGEEIPEDKLSISVISFSNDELTFAQNTDVYDNTLSAGRFQYTKISDDSIERLWEREYTRPLEFIQYEKFQFNQPISLSFTRSQVSKEELFKEIKAALNTPPTLMEEDIPLPDLMKYISATKDLICPAYPVSRSNPAPTIQELDHYLSLTDYEKRLINKGDIMPMQVLKIVERLKNDLGPNYIFSIDHKELINPSKSIEESVSKIEEYINKDRLDESVKEKINTAFQNKFRFTPRVANDYIYGRSLRGSSPLTDEKIEKYVNEFNRNSITKVAGTKSIALLGISDLIDFGQFPERQRNILASYIKEKDIKKLADKGFFTWIKKNKNVSPNDILFILESTEKLPKIAENDNIKNIKDKIKNAKGIEECKKFEAHYSGFKFSDNVLAIKGRHTEATEGKITMRMLQADDYGHFTVGYDTYCCQHFGDAGESCVYEAVTDPFATTVVIEEDGKVKAQAFTWADELTSTLVFDNVEFAGGNMMDDVLSKKFLNIMSEWISAMPYKNVHVGTGYNQSMNGWGKRITKEEYATLPTTLRIACRYSDYHDTNARVLKKDGETLLKRTSTSEIKIKTAPDEPTIYDELASPAFNFMLNDYHKTIEERLDFAKQIHENPSDENQMKLIMQNPKAVGALDNVAESVQKYMIDHYPEYCSMIKNPIPECRYASLKLHPEEIIKIPQEELTEDMAKIALSAKGSLLSSIPNELRTSAVCEEALKNDPSAIKDVPTESLTETMELNIADKEPKALIGLPILSDAVLHKAIEKEPYLVTVFPDLSQEAKLLAIRQVPDLVLDIKNPLLEGETPEIHNAKLKELWQAAVRENPYLIRNCGRSYPDFRLEAIRQNPYVITQMADSNKEEIRTAVSIEPKVWNMIKHPERRAYAKECAMEVCHGHIPEKKGPSPLRENELTR